MLCQKLNKKLQKLQIAKNTDKFNYYIINHLFFKRVLNSINFAAVFLDKLTNKHFFNETSYDTERLNDESFSSVFLSFKGKVGAVVCWILAQRPHLQGAEC